ncbi:MAG: hypothetical protein CL693_22055 [Cellvibrionaceae bacterium]|nr:hypothetical protein [Cellvibrionaceae bacterium]
MLKASSREILTGLITNGSDGYTGSDIAAQYAAVVCAKPGKCFSNKAEIMDAFFVLEHWGINIECDELVIAASMRMAGVGHQIKLHRPRKFAHLDSIISELFPNHELQTQTSQDFHLETSDHLNAEMIGDLVKEHIEMIRPVRH